MPQSTVDQLQAFYNEEPTGSFGTPYPKLGSKIAITAWTGTRSYEQNGYYGQGHIAICPSYNAATKKAFEAFRSAFRGHGPEGIPICAGPAGHGPVRRSTSLSLIHPAGVAELADAAGLKPAVPSGRGGSIPSPGIL